MGTPLLGTQGNGCTNIEHGNLQHPSLALCRAGPKAQREREDREEKSWNYLQRRSLAVEHSERAEEARHLKFDSMCAACVHVGVGEGVCVPFAPCSRSTV